MCVSLTNLGSCLRLDLSWANNGNHCSEVMTYSVGDFLSPLTPCRSTASSDLPLFISITILSLLAFSFVLENENNRWLNALHDDGVLKNTYSCISIQTFSVDPKALRWFILDHFAIILRYSDILVLFIYYFSIYFKFTLYFTCIFSHLADPFIQNDLQMMTIKAIKPTKEQYYTSAMTSLS